MSRWLVTQGDHQFSAKDLNELKELAKSGRVGAGDMVQPPGASDWLYASEVPELAVLFPSDGGGEDDDLDWDMPKNRSRTPLAVLLLGIVAFGGYGMWDYGQKLPDHQDLGIIGGKTGMTLTEMIASSDVTIRSTPDAQGQGVGSVAKDSIVKLLGKRGDWYQIQNESGAQGYVETNTVVPAYYFADAETRQSHDPVYNPDRYVFVKNSSWMQLPDQREENVTIFQFLLQNKSKFGMTAIKLLATIKDKNDRVIETKEIAIEGNIPAFDGAMVGTLKPAADDLEGAPRLMTTTYFDVLLKADETLMSRWSDGVEVAMESEGFVEANIDLLQVRAIPEKE
jgi:hypothetical protein